MVISSKNDAKSMHSPVRILTKKALRTYFQVTPARFRRYYYTQELKEKLGITSVSQDRRTKTFNLEQSAIIIEHFKLSPEELNSIAKLL